ncbi:MAG: extracellular solute-binding protein [Candidatus Rokubacteria bacterium]|nr:extracellular solute-binding protein [Candidatus Rokubacteria bacterium]
MSHTRQLDLSRRAFLASAAGAAAGLVPLTAARAQRRAVTLKVLARDYTLRLESPWRTAAAELKRRHPELDLNVELEGSPYNDQRRKALISTQAGHGADILQMDNIWLGEFAEGGIVQDVTARFNAWKEREDVPPVFVKTASWKDRVYGLWLNADVRLLHWNKRVFRKFGLDPARPPQTWDELVAMAAKCTSPPNSWGYVFPGGQAEETVDRWLAFLYQLGGSVLTPGNERAAFNSEAGVRSLTFLADLVNKHKVTPRDILGSNQDELTNVLVTSDRFAMGIVVGTGFRPGGTAEYKTPEEFAQVRGAAVLPVPSGGRRATVMGGWILTIGRNSQNADLAWEYLTIVTAEPAAREFWQKQQRVPTRKAAFERVGTYSQVMPYFDQIAESVPFARLAPQVPQYPSFLSFMITAIQRVLAGEAAPKVALDEAAAQTNEVLKR